MLPSLRIRSGVVVAMRSPDASYGQLELRPGDVIHAVNGEPITGLAQLRRTIEAVEVGGPVVLQVERNGQLRFMAFEME